MSTFQAYPPTSSFSSSTSSRTSPSHTSPSPPSISTVSTPQKYTATFTTMTLGTPLDIPPGKTIPPSPRPIRRHVSSRYADLLPPTFTRNFI
ncbi:hypothetical protein DL98DRAFT_515905 [Cadophora sp. DSE1049]|nr:hypothetical protein DL98DRAFT_515905 [Cadophora sp. DSE1049]